MTTELICDARNLKDRFLPNYYKIKKAKTDYVVIYGSGGSAKSYSAAQYFTKNLTEKKEKLVVLRKVGADIRQSVFSQFIDTAFKFWRLEEKYDYKVSKPEGKYEILFPDSGSTILFRGVEDPQRFKSINGVTLLWIEEASEFTEEEFNIISDRIRGENVRIYLTFNPISEDHWLKKRFIDTPILDVNGNSRVTVIFSTYLENPFVGNKFIEDMNWYKVHDPDHYDVYGLGKWGVIASKRPFINSIDYNKQFVKCFDWYRQDLPVYISLDFNVKWTATIRQQIPGKGRVYLECIRDYPAELILYLATKYGGYEVIITGDASGRNNTQYTTDESKKSAWLLFRSEFNGHCCRLYNRSESMQQRAFFNDKYVLSKNIGHDASRVICNALLIVWGEVGQVWFDEDRCKILKDDCKRIDATPSGGLNKVKLNNEDIGHALDCLRYDICYCDFDKFEALGLYKKQIKQMTTYEYIDKRAA